MGVVKKTIKSLYLRMKYYNLKTKKTSNKYLIFFLGNDYHQPHPGFADRLKAIVGLYYIAQENGYDFKIVDNLDFCLSKYLRPNKIDWNCNKEDISYSLWNTKILFYDGMKNTENLKANMRQIHCYYYEGKNILRSNNLKNWEEKWRDLYHELFIPSDSMKELILKYCPKEKFIAVHIRFVNALDCFEKGYDKNLTLEEQAHLIKKCLEKIAEVKAKENKTVFVFSDSVRFLNIAKENGYSVLPTSNIGHISFEQNVEIYEKMLIDFFVISEAEKVYLLSGNHLYNSAFSQYAAIVGAKQYIINEIE